MMTDHNSVQHLGRDGAQKPRSLIGSERWREAIIFVFLLLLVVLLRYPSLHLPFENDSGDHAYHARLILEGLPLYGVHHPAHHMPAVYYLYALAFTIFGQSPFAIKLFLIGWLAVTVYLIYRLGMLATNRSTALLAATFSAILFAHVGLSAHSARRELFVVLPQVAAILVLFHALRQKRRNWPFFFVGLFGAGSFLFKVNYISPIALAIFGLASDLWQGRKERVSWKSFIERSCWLAGGFIAAVVPVAAYFASQGLLDRFLLVFTIGLRYLAVRPHPFLTGPQYMVLYPMGVLALNNALMLVLALSALILIALQAIRRIQEPQKNGARFWMGYISLWFLLTLITTNVSRSYLHHYYLIFIPSFSLLIAWLLIRIYNGVLHAGNHYRPRMAAAVLGTFVSLILALSVVANFDLYYHYLRYTSGAETYREFMVRGLPDEAGLVSQEMAEVADYVRTQTDPDDQLYYWGNFMEFYWLVERRSVVDMIWPITVGVTGPRERIFRAEYIVIGNHTMVGVEYMPAWLADGLEEHYELEAMIHGRRIYKQADTDQG